MQRFILTNVTFILVLLCTPIVAMNFDVEIDHTSHRKARQLKIIQDSIARQKARKQSEDSSSKRQTRPALKERDYGLRPSGKISRIAIGICDFKANFNLKLDKTVIACALLPQRNELSLATEDGLFEYSFDSKKISPLHLFTSDEKLENIAFSPSGRYAIFTAAPYVDQIFILDLISGEKIPFNTKSSIACLNDDETYLVICDDSALKFYSIPDKALIITLDLTTPISHFALSHHSKDFFSNKDAFMVTAAIKIPSVMSFDNKDGIVTNERAQLHGHTSEVSCITIDSTNRYIATGSDDGTMRIWDAATGNCLYVTPAQSSPVTRITFSIDGTSVLQCSKGGEISKWDLKTRARTGYYCKPDDASTVVKLTNRGDYIFASSGNNVDIWSTRSFAQIMKLIGHTSPIVNMTMNYDASIVVTTSADGQTLGWNLRMGS